MNHPPCIIKDCGRPHNARGLCNSHFATSAMKVKNGITTWEKLEKEGKALPAMTQEEKNATHRHKYRKFNRASINV